MKEQVDLEVPENKTINISENVLFLIFILGVILGLIFGTLTTYYQYKELVNDQREQIKLLEQSLGEQIVEKHVYETKLEILKERYEVDSDV